MSQGFFEQVYEIVAGIPAGTVISYGKIAALLGSPRAARVVGYAMRAAPPKRNLPCHRVVGKEGGLAPESSFGPGIQRKRLEEEGVTFLPDGRVDMAKHRWL